MFGQHNKKNSKGNMDKSMNAYISDDKSALTGIHERKKTKQMNVRDDQSRFFYGQGPSHNLLNDMSMDSLQYNMSALDGAPSAMNEHDKMAFEQHMFKKMKAGKNAAVLDHSDLNSESQFEGGGQEE